MAADISPFSCHASAGCYKFFSLHLTYLFLTPPAAAPHSLTDRSAAAFSRRSQSVTL